MIKRLTQEALADVDVGHVITHQDVGVWGAAERKTGLSGQFKWTNID